MYTDQFVSLHENVAFLDDPHVVVYLNDEIRDFPTHWHTPLEILMPIDNIYTARVNNKEYVLQPYDILFVAPNVHHSYEAPGSGQRYFILADMSVLSNIVDFQEILSFVNPTALFPADESSEIHARLKSLFLEICDIYLSQDNLYVSASHSNEDADSPRSVSLTESLVYSKLIEMLTLIVRKQDSSQRVVFPSGKQQDYINQFVIICNYIDAHCTENLSLEGAAKMSGFSKYHFARLFKEFTHESFYKYVNKKRIRYSEQLLLHQKLSVTEVALSSGFSNTSSFIRMFKLMNGCTPREFRKSKGGVERQGSDRAQQE